MVKSLGIDFFAIKPSGYFQSLFLAVRLIGDFLDGKVRIFHTTKQVFYFVIKFITFYFGYLYRYNSDQSGENGEYHS